MVNLFTTFVIATIPTFWLNDVIGRQPNTDESALTNPSHAIEPDVSFSVAYLSSPEEASAEVSPIVSVAETKNISTTDTMASALNSILNGIRCGIAIILISLNEEKSTTPIINATIYPTIRPKRTDNCL